MSETFYDLVVIGAGPGGYVAAIRAAQLGMRVACVERQFVGGTCLNIGCIPSKALLDSSLKYYEAKHKFSRHGIKVADVTIDVAAMQARKQQVVNQLTGGVAGLFKKNKVDHVVGAARIAAPDTVEVTGGKPATLKTRRVLIATGSAPVELKGLPFDGKNILSSTEALALAEIPKRLLIIGAGYIGVEMASLWSRLGSNVTIIEFLDRAIPTADKEMAGLLQRMLEKQGIKFHFKTGAESAEVRDGVVRVSWKSTDGASGIEECDKCLVAIGRKPVTDTLGLGKLGVTVDKKGFIQVGDHYETNIRGIYAIGDVIGGLMLAHKAEDEGIAAVERMVGKAGHVNYRTIPGVVYTHPELAQVGWTEEDAQKNGHEIRVGKFPLTANGRARAADETDGLIKIVADAKSDRILGVHILAAHASEMIAEAVVAMEFAASAEDLARTCHAHPTMSEGAREAAMAVDRRAIHI
jgi:dihydrolipoamide dehydrogenase